MHIINRVLIALFAIISRVPGIARGVYLEKNSINYFICIYSWPNPLLKASSLLLFYFSSRAFDGFNSPELEFTATWPRSWFGTKNK